MKCALLLQEVDQQADQLWLRAASGCLQDESMTMQEASRLSRRSRTDYIDRSTLCSILVLQWTKC